MRQTNGLGFFIYLTLVVGTGFYFAYAAIQGDLGIIQRMVIEADRNALEDRRAELQHQVDILENKTRRLSDGYLDLDLLDERARDVLGMMRADEVVVD